MLSPSTKIPMNGAGVHPVWRGAALCGAIVLFAACEPQSLPSPPVLGSIGLSVSAPATISVAPGTSGAMTVTLTRGGGFAAPVTLMVEGLPTGVTSTVTPSTLDGSTSSAVVSISAGATAVAGSSGLLVRARGAGVGDATTAITFTVVAQPGFTIATIDSPLTVAAGGAPSSLTVTALRAGGYAEPIALSIEGLPTGVSATTATVAAGGGVAALQLTASASASAGTTTATVRARGAGLPDRTLIIPIVVAATPSFSLSVTPVTVGQGDSAAVAVSVLRSGGFSGPIALSVSGLPAGVTAGVATIAEGQSSASVRVAASYQARVDSSEGAITGAATTVIGTRSARLPILVTASGYTLVLSAPQIAQGDSAPLIVTATRTGSFRSSIVVTLSGLPAGVTGNATVIIPEGQPSATTILRAALTTLPGGSTITATGSAPGPATQTATSPLIVIASGYTIAVGALDTLRRGSSRTVPITITRQGSFRGEITLAVSGAATGITATLDAMRIAATVSRAQLTVAAAQSAAVAATALTVRGTATGIPDQTRSVAVVVTGTDTIGLALAGSAEIGVPRGGSVTVPLFVLRNIGGRQTVVLSVFAAPTGVTASVAPRVLDSLLVASTVTLSASATATSGLLGIAGDIGPGRAPPFTSAPVRIDTIGVELAPASVSVRQAGSATVGITLERPSTFATIPVTYGVAGLPAGVTASFSTTGGLTNTSTLTLRATSAAVVGRYTVLVGATALGVTTQRTLILEVLLDVTGTYALKSLDGKAVPGETYSDSTYVINTTGGALTIRENYTFGFGVAATGRNRAGGAMFDESSSGGGTYTVSGNTISFFVVPKAGENLVNVGTATLVGNRLTLFFSARDSDGTVVSGVAIVER